MTEVYISTDIETNGPIPGDYSMLSLGAASFTPEGKLLSTFSVNLEHLIGASEHPDTMAWWETNKVAYNTTREGMVPPKEAMERYVAWIKKQPGSPVFVGYPAGFDFLFVYWYLIHFVGESPFSISALDIKSYAMAVLKTDYRKSTKKNMPQSWFPKDKHTHIAMDDAIEQGKLFCNMLHANIKA